MSQRPKRPSYRRRRGHDTRGRAFGFDRRAAGVAGAAVACFEQAGHRSPLRMQRLFGEAVWDAEAVRDDVRAFVVDRLAHPDSGDQRSVEGTAPMPDDLGTSAASRRSGGHRMSA